MDPERPSGSRSEQEWTDGPEALFEALGTDGCRRTLYVLLDRREVEVEELADALAGWRSVAEGAVVGPEEHRDLLVALRHAHLPALAERGLLRYDRETGAVHRLPLDDAAQSRLRRAAESEAAHGVDPAIDEDDSRLPGNDVDG